jgi:hypothetical protein
VVGNGKGEPSAGRNFIFDARLWNPQTSILSFRGIRRIWSWRAGVFGLVFDLTLMAFDAVGMIRLFAPQLGAFAIFRRLGVAFLAYVAFGAELNLFGFGLEAI